MRKKNETFAIKSKTFSIGDKQMNINDKINGLVIDENIEWEGCKDGEMRPTECDWDFSGMSLEELLRLAWNHFKVEVRTKFFKKLLKEEGLKLLHEKTRSGITIRVKDALNYNANIDNEVQRAVDRERINAVKAMLDVGASEDAIIRSLEKRFQCTQDEAEDYYNTAYGEQ